MFNLKHKLPHIRLVYTSWYIFTILLSSKTKSTFLRLPTKKNLLFSNKFKAFEQGPDADIHASPF